MAMLGRKFELYCIFRILQNCILLQNYQKNIYQHYTIVHGSNYAALWSEKVRKSTLIENKKGNHLTALDKHYCSSDHHWD